MDTDCWVLVNKGGREGGREGGEKRVLEERRVREGRDRQVNGQEGE